MRLTALLFFLITFCTGIIAQDCSPWFPFKKGSSFEYTFFDKKDKVTSRMAYEVVDMKSSAAGYEYQVSATLFDKKEEEVSSFEFSVSCSDGSYRANVSNFMNPQMNEIFGEAKIKVTGDELVIPKKLTVGQTLPDANSMSEAEIGIITMKVEVDITGREVVEKTTVDTPIKQFEAYKITSTENVKMPMMKRTYQSVGYFAEGVGQVKSESMDKKGRVASYMLLTKFDP